MAIANCNQRAYSLGSFAVGQTDGRIALFQNAPPPIGRGYNNLPNTVQYKLVTGSVFRGQKMLYAGGECMPLTQSPRLWIRHCRFHTAASAM